jgi:hypothetical protein
MMSIMWGGVYNLFIYSVGSCQIWWWADAVVWEGLHFASFVELPVRIRRWL